MFLPRPSEERSRKRVALAELYEAHFERVARYIAVRIGNADEAEDLAAEVFVRALRSVDSYKETGAPMEAWVFRIAHNILVDHLRARGRRPAPMPLEDAPPVASADNPTTQMERQEEAQALRRAMEQLTDAQRRVLALRFGGEMTSEQVAQVLKKSPGAVREMQSAAIRRLRQVMEDEQQRPGSS